MLLLLHLLLVIVIALHLHLVHLLLNSCWVRHNHLLVHECRLLELLQLVGIHCKLTDLRVHELAHSHLLLVCLVKLRHVVELLLLVEYSSLISEQRSSILLLWLFFLLTWKQRLILFLLFKLICFLRKATLLVSVNDLVENIRELLREPSTTLSLSTIL